MIYLQVATDMFCFILSHSDLNLTLLLKLQFEKMVAFEGGEEPYVIAAKRLREKNA